jgi:hypothetical protein
MSSQWLASQISRATGIRKSMLRIFPSCRVSCEDSGLLRYQDVWEANDERSLSVADFRFLLSTAEPDVLAQIIPHLSNLTSKSQAEQYLYVNLVGVGFYGMADQCSNALRNYAALHLQSSPLCRPTPTPASRRHPSRRRDHNQRRQVAADLHTIPDHLLHPAVNGAMSREEEKPILRLCHPRASRDRSESSSG